MFTGTRVPVQALFDNLEEGRLEEFLDGFPSVTKDHAVAVIQLAAKKLVIDSDKIAACAANFDLPRRDCTSGQNY